MDDKKISKNKWKIKDQANFFETLDDMLNNGFSLKQSLINLKILYPKYKFDFETALRLLKEGKTFSEGIRNFIDPKIYYQLMLAEKHGQLELCVAQLGKYMHQRMKQHEKIKGAMLYLCILLGLLIVMIVLLFTWLCPTIVSLNEQSGSNLQAISWLSQIFKIVGIGILCIIFCYLCYGIYWVKKQPSIARNQWLSKLPVIGRLYRNYSYYYLSFNLALLLKSGLDFQEICNFLCQFESTTLLCQLGKRLKYHLLAGKEIKTFIREYSFIPPELTIFLNKGQTAYELSEDLLIYSNNRYQKLIKIVNQLINLIQPVAFLVIALIIIGIYLSILIPIYSNLGGLS